MIDLTLMAAGSPVIFWHAPQSLPLAIASAVVLLAAIVWLYPGQLQLISWPWRIMLPLLRALAVLALAVSLLKPVAVRIASSRERGSLLVLLDRSRSMSIVDNERTPAQLVALADALGRLPEGVRAAPVAELQGELSRLRQAAGEVEAAREDLDFALISGRDVEPRQGRLREVFAAYTSAARALVAQGAALPGDPELRQKLAELADVPRADSEASWKTLVPEGITQVLGELTRYQENADTRLYAGNLQVHRACDDVAKVSRYELAEAALLDPQRGLLNHLDPQIPVSVFAVSDRESPLVARHDGRLVGSFQDKPTGLASDLTGTILSAAAGSPVRSIVLLTDGRQVGGDARRVAGLTPSGVPIFTVGVAAIAGPRDLSLTDVRVPSGAFVGDTITVRAQIRHEGFDGVAVNVKLEVTGLATQWQRVDLKAGLPAAVAFPVELKSTFAGIQKVELSVAPLPGEASDENNRIERWIKVMPERIRVSVVAGSPSWDFQYLRNMLARRTDIQLHEGVLDAHLPRLAMSPAEILRQDIVVLFDVPVSALDPGQWDAMLRLVDERGGSVILVAGDAHLPDEYANPIPAAALLPFDLSRVRPRFKLWPGEQPAFRFTPDPESAALDVLKLGNDNGGLPRRWEELPPTFQFLQLPPMSEGKFKPGTQVLLTEVDSGSPVLLERRLGAGRTLFLGLNETWRWRYKVGERDQDRIWRQLIHYGAQSPYFANSASLSLDADRVFARPQESVRVRARILDEKQPSPVCSLQIFTNNKLFAKETLMLAGSMSAGRYEGSIALPAGEYDLRLAGNREQVHLPLRVSPSEEAEMENLAGNNDLLRRIAESSGGEFFTLDQMAHLPDRLSGVAESRSHFADLRLWDSPYLFLFVVSCLSAEWAIRKRSGLA